MNKALPSAEHPIASQEPASAAAAKAAHLKLRKRPEDELAAADPSAAAPATDQEVQLAQAAPDAAAEGMASAGGGTTVAAADGTAAATGGGSAAAGAGAPVAAAAAPFGGIGMGALALGGGAVAVAAAAHGGGGGGSGGGGGAGGGAGPMPVPAPGQMPSVLVKGFSDYVAAINQGGASTAATATGTIITGANPAHTDVEVSGGFSRSALPKMAADLRPTMTYNVSGANGTVINDGGIVVDLQGNPTGDSHLTAASNAAAGASNLMWMQTLGVKDAASHGATIATASSTAGGAHADAEIGIQHVSMDLAGAGAMNGRTDLAARATDGGSAHTLASDVTLHMNSSGVGTSAAPLSTQIHMGFGEGIEPGMIASASGGGSSANVGVAGNVSLSAHGDDVYAFNSGVFAQGTNGGSAHTDIGGNMTFAADGREAHTYALIDASTDGSTGSVGDVHIHGNVNLNSTGSALALTRAAVRAEGTGSVEIDGHLSVDSTAPTANSAMQVIAQGGTGEISIGALDMNMNGGGHGWMDLYTDHSGGLSIGAVNLSTTAGSDVTLHVQNANNATNGTVDSTFLGHADSTVGVSIASANLGGAGDVHMFLNSQTFGTINQAASVGRLDLHYQLADHDFAGIGSAPMTTINGFSASHDEVIYNGVLANNTNFTNAGSFNSLSSLNAALVANLDATHKYVFAVYTGTEDINHNGVADDHNAGVLAWDNNGTGISSVLILPGVTALTASDIAWPAPPPPPPVA